MSISKNKNSNLEYNNTCKKARITIFKSELDKCMTNQPFEINYRLPKKLKLPVTPRGMPKWFKLWSETQFEPLRETLNKVIKLNNLKIE